MLTYCTRCVMPHTKPHPYIDGEGVGNVCRSFSSGKSSMRVPAIPSSRPSRRNAGKQTSGTVRNGTILSEGAATDRRKRCR